MLTSAFLVFHSTFPNFSLQSQFQKEQINAKINERHERSALLVAHLPQVHRGSKQYFRANSGLHGNSRQDLFLTNIPLLIIHKLQ
jgi:hypothetical protein